MIRRTLSAGLLVMTLGLSTACDQTPNEPSPTPAPAPAPTPTPPQTPPLTPDTPTQPALLTVSGVISEGGVGPLGDVTVSVRNGPSTVTDSQGRFELAVGHSGAVSFEKSGYWTRYRDVRNLVEPFALTLQRELVMPSVPGSLTATIHPDDPAYFGKDEEVFWDGGYDCSPCKAFAVRVRNAAARVSLRWSGDARLSMWVGAYYEGVTLRATAAAGTRIIVLDTPTHPSLDYVLVGLESPDGQRQPLSEPVPIDISVELR